MHKRDRNGNKEFISREDSIIGLNRIVCLLWWSYHEAKTNREAWNILDSQTTNHTNGRNSFIISSKYNVALVLKALNNLWELV